MSRAKTRAQVVSLLAAHFSAKLNGAVLADYDPDTRKYSISGHGLPAHPDLQAQYPNGWELLAHFSPSEARKIVGDKPIDPPVRVKFVYDQDATFEECNGEARPLTEAEYAENYYMGCPIHPRGTKEPSSTVPGKPGLGLCACGQTYAPIPYAEYLAYYGNPDRHVYLGCIVQTQCACCDSWVTGSSLWRIDFMDDNTEYDAIPVDKWMDRAKAEALPGYAGETVREQIAEALATVKEGHK